MGPEGVPVGSIQKELEIPSSTLSHHISKLTKVGLVKQQRDGRILYCSPDLQKLQGMIDFLVDECCQGESCEVLENNEQSGCC